MFVQRDINNFEKLTKAKMLPCVSHTISKEKSLLTHLWNYVMNKSTLESLIYREQVKLNDK